MPRPLLALIAVVAVLAGCGGGGDDKGAGGDGAPSREKFVSEANKICREGSAKINAKAREVQDKLKGANSAKEQQKVVADVLEETAKEYDPYLERLHDLKPPAKLSADWSRFLDGIDKAFDLIPELADATRAGDRDKLANLTTQFTQIAGDTRPFATKYKLDDCLPETTS